MQIKRSGSKIFGAHLTKNEHLALEIEVRKMIVENEDKYRAGMDAAILYYLHDKYGFGIKRLRDFWNGFNELHDEMVRHYLISPQDAAWVCKEKLKRIGVDVDKWYEEDEQALKGGGRDEKT
jgi:hypothetical protein